MDKDLRRLSEPLSAADGCTYACLPWHAVIVRCSRYQRGRTVVVTRLAPIEAGLRMHSLRTWLLWLVGAVVMGFLFRWDPALMIYLMEPEFVAGWMLFAFHYATRFPRYVWALCRTGWRSAAWWHELTCRYVMLRARETILAFGPTTA